MSILVVDADPTEPIASLRALAHEVGDPCSGFVKDDGALVRLFAVRSLDTTVVVDREGRCLGVVTGESQGDAGEHLDLGDHI